MIERPVVAHAVLPPVQVAALIGVWVRPAPTSSMTFLDPGYAVIQGCSTALHPREHPFP
jgi:hypothetical protein